MSVTEHSIRPTWHGRNRYRATCTCGWQDRSGTRRLADAAAGRHHLEHGAS